MQTAATYNMPTRIYYMITRCGLRSLEMKNSVKVSLLMKIRTVFGTVFPLLALSLLTVAGHAAQQPASTAPARAEGQSILANPEQLVADQMARMLAEVPRFEWDSVQLSPDGSQVAYSVVRRSLETNEVTKHWFLQRLPSGESPLPPAVPLPLGAGSVRWCPDSKCLSMKLDASSGDTKEPQRFTLYSVATGELKAVPAVNDTDSTAGSPGKRPRITNIPSVYKWSPSGAYITFVAPLAKRGGVDPRRGVTGDVWEAPTRQGLFVLEIHTGRVTQLTSETLNGRIDGWSVEWSPDESELVFTVVPDHHSGISKSDLYVVERATGKVRDLVVGPGMNTGPHWSPDGRWIAFSSRRDSMRSGILGWPAVVPAKGGSPKVFPKDGTPMVYIPDVWWSQDSRIFFYDAALDMTSHLIRADTEALRTAVMSAPAGNIHLPHDDHRSFSSDRRRMAFTRESLTTPPELFVVGLDAAGRPSGKPRQITQLSPTFSIGKQVRTEALEWPSTDGKFTIHALLLTPASAWSGERITRPLPTLLYFEGGPRMVRRGFADDGLQGSLLMLAARGYAVLVPNTRGRGGYGQEFHRALQDEQRVGQGGYEDGIAGVDLLIKRRISDPERLGVFGFSFGGYWTRYTITQTHRFKAAIDAEGVGNSFLDSSNVGSRFPETYIVPGGYANPYDPTTRKNMIADSTILHADRIKTPTMLLFGAKSLAKEGSYFHNALRRFSVPSAFFVYDEGHGFNRPAAIADSLIRASEWFDYWLRGIPYPNEERAKEYNEWRAATDKQNTAGTATNAPKP